MRGPVYDRSSRAKKTGVPREGANAGRLKLDRKLSLRPSGRARMVDAAGRDVPGIKAPGGTAERIEAALRAHACAPPSDDADRRKFDWGARVDAGAQSVIVEDNALTADCCLHDLHRSLRGHDVVEAATVDEARRGPRRRRAGPPVAGRADPGRRRRGRHPTRPAPAPSSPRSRTVAVTLPGHARRSPSRCSPAAGSAGRAAAGRAAGRRAPPCRRCRWCRPCGCRRCARAAGAGGAARVGAAGAGACRPVPPPPPLLPQLTFNRRPAAPARPAAIRKRDPKIFMFCSPKLSDATSPSWGRRAK